MVMRKSPHCYKKAHAEETIRSKKSRHVMDEDAEIKSKRNSFSNSKYHKNIHTLGQGCDDKSG